MPRYNSLLLIYQIQSISYIHVSSPIVNTINPSLMYTTASV